MTSSVNNQTDDFVADDFEADIQDDFQPDESTDKQLKELSWVEKNFTEKGQNLKAKENRNLLKGVISGATAGYSEAIPGLAVEEGSSGVTGKVTGSLLPISYAAKAISYPLQAAAKAAPKLAKPLQHLGGLLGISAAGGLYEGLEESAKNSIEAGEFVAPSAETIAEKGAIWGGLDLALKGLGWSARFARGLLNKSAELGVPATEVLDSITNQLKNTDKTAEKALSILENKPLETIEKEAMAVEKTADVSNEVIQQKVAEQESKFRNIKVNKEQLDRIGTNAVEVRPYLPKEFASETIAEEVLSEDLSKRIDQVARRAPTERELGQNIQGDIERNIEISKSETDALYQVAKEVESTQTPNLKETATSIVEQLKKLEAGNLNLTPEGYNKAQRQLYDTLADLGYGVEQDSAGQIVRAVKHSDIPLSKAVEIKRRMNNIINYDLTETSAQDFLKDPAYKLRGEVRKGYGNKNSPARKAFEKAEEKFAEFAEKKGKKSIRSIRTSEKPESVAKTIRTPSGLADIKEISSPEQFAQVERELLEHFKSLPEDKAASLYRELRPSLSENARSITEEIIESKAARASPNRKVAQREAIQKKAIDDIAKATITGERPDIALNLWKTTEGQQLIKHALENNPNKKEVLQYLQDQSFKDFIASVITPEGKIDFKKLDKLLKDPATLSNTRLVAGEEGVNFLKNLEQISNRVKKNASIIEGKIDKASATEREAINREIKKRGESRMKSRVSKRKEAEELEKIQETPKLIHKIDDFLANNYGVKAKSVLSLLGIWKLGTIEGLAASAGYEVISRLARNKKVQDAFKKAAVPNSSPTAFIKSVFDIADAVEEED